MPPADVPNRCKNCGAPFVGLYCAQCGQEARPRLVPIHTFLTEQLREFFSLDTRFFHSFGWLLRKPGFLTNEYVAGRRVRYLPPLRLYVVCSFLFFFIVALVRTDLSGLTTLAPPSDPPADTTAVDSTKTPPDSVAAEVFAQPDTTLAMDSVQLSDSMTIRDSTRTARLRVDSSSWYYRFGYRIGRASRKVEQDRTAFESSLLNRLSPTMFFLLPAFAFILQFLFIRHDILYAQHFIFALHTHAFAFLVLLVLFVLDALGVPMVIKPENSRGQQNMIAPLFLLVFWIYLFLAMRRVYGQARWKTLIKLTLLTLMYMMIFGIAFVVVAVITLLLF